MRKSLYLLPALHPPMKSDVLWEKKQGWIDKTVARQKKENAQRQDKDYETGEQFLYLGQFYPLEAFFEPFENAKIVFGTSAFISTVAGISVAKTLFCFMV